MNDFKIAMKDFNIVNLMCVGFEDYEEFINGKVKKSKEYKEAEKTFEKHLDTLKKAGYECWSEFDDAVTVIEFTARDIAFNEGFRMGVRFIQDFIAKGEALEHVG